jgi:hypothetical protein
LQPERGVLGFERVGERSSEVLQLECQPTEQRRLFGASRERAALLGEGEHVHRQATTHVIELVALREALLSELAHGLEYREAVVLATHEMGLHQREQVAFLGGADPRGGFTRPPTTKHS